MAALEHFDVFVTSAYSAFADQESAATLVHAFATSRVDYCNTLLADATKVTTDKLQRVLNAAARILAGTHKKLS